MFSDISLLSLPLCLSSHVDRRDDEIEWLFAIGIDYRLLDYWYWDAFCSHDGRWAEADDCRSVELPLVVSLPRRYFFRFFLISCYYSKPILMLILIPTLL